MNRQKNFLLPICYLLILLFSCNSEENTAIPVKFERFDEAIFSQNLPQLLQSYPDFAPFYLEKLIEVGTPNDSTTASYFQEFKKTYQKEIYDSVKLVFEDISEIEQQLGKALGNYKSAFPNDSLPKFYTHFSGFNEAIISTNSIISVSLENYLGKSSYYEKLGVYQYLRNKMYPEKIPVDILKLLLLKKTATKNATNNLLSAMLYQGKILYTLQQMFPKRNVAFLLNYTKEQEKWCKANEAMMWQFIIEQKHLFSSDYKTIRGYIDPAPFTKGFPNESPGETGIWIGYQIIKNYTENTETLLKVLLQETDYEKILKLSAYNPES